MALSPALRTVLAELLDRSERTRTLGLDDVASAIGAAAASASDVEEIFAALEAAGRTIADAEGTTSPKADLAEVIAAARAITLETGRRPTPAAIAERTGLSEDRVRAALRFASIMAR